jgi:hypothetical protein
VLAALTGVVAADWAVDKRSRGNGFREVGERPAIRAAELA